MAEGGADFDWYLWGEAGAASGFTGRTAKAASPNVYTISGDTVTLRKSLGKPYPAYGVAFSETKCGGGRFKGDQTYNQEYTYVGGVMGDLSPPNLTDLRGFGPFKEGEIVTGEMDNANTAEETIMALLFTYGAIGHKYPTSILEVIEQAGIAPKKIFSRQFSITVANVLTAGDPAVAFMTASQEDLWFKSDKDYYILGAIPHLSASQLLLECVGNLPEKYAGRHAAVIPIGTGADEVRFRASQLCLPYEAIGPLNGDALPSLGAFGLDAAAFTFAMILAEV